ncbi:MAG: AbrB/MazE/SpoVT family DNA-binding domain-containing protein [Candidatus Bathyarchaeia archaeon]
MEKIIKVGKKGVIVLPKKVREEAGVREGGSIRVKTTPAGVLLIPRFESPAKELSNLPVNRPAKPTIEVLRGLRGEVHRELKVEG